MTDRSATLAPMCRIDAGPHGRRLPGGRRRTRGFTLIEIGIVIFVMAMIIGLAIPTLRDVTGAQARAEASKLASNIRATRGHAAVSGQTCRVVFCLGGCDENVDSPAGEALSSYHVECAEGTVATARESIRNGRREGETRSGDDLTEAEKFRQQLKSGGRFTPSAALGMQQLRGLQLASVWTAHQEEQVTKGTAYLYFYPSGQGERANIQLQDGDDWYSLHVSPLSGKVAMFNSREELPEEREEED